MRRRRVSDVIRTVSLLLLLLFAFFAHAPEAAAASFAYEIIDNTIPQWIGRFSSLSFDAAGNEHIIYWDDFWDDVKYARRVRGAWVIEVVDNTIVGAWSSLALDAAGNAHVTYQEFAGDNLKYAKRAGSAWSVETVDSPNAVGLYTSIAADASGNPHVSYYDATTGNLRYAKKSAGAWTIEYADASAQDVGQYSSLALDRRGNVYIAYKNATSGDLNLAVRTTSGWSLETVDNSLNDVGNWASIAIDLDGKPRISYQDATNNWLLYATVDYQSGFDRWVIEVVDASGAAGTGAHTSLALDRNGESHILYFRGANADLGHASHSGGLWSFEYVDQSPNDVGRYPSARFDPQDNLAVSYYDQTQGAMKFATSAVRLVSPHAAAVWPVGSSQSVSWIGAGAVKIEFSADGGATYQTLVSNATSSPVNVRVPHTPTRYGRVRVVREGAPSFAASDSFITVDATISLAKFEGARVEDGADQGAVLLAWSTTPAPPLIEGYRVMRSDDCPADDAPCHYVAVHSDLLREPRFLDRAPGSGAAYRLYATNGLGEEYVLGETVVAPALAPGRWLGTYPNPARAGICTIICRAPRGLAAAEVTIHDVAGRRVRSIGLPDAGESLAELAWDGKSADGTSVAPGVYLVSLRSGAKLLGSHRITVTR